MEAEEIVRPNGQSVAISTIRSVMLRNLRENREGRSGSLRVVGQSPEWRHVLRKNRQVNRLRLYEIKENLSAEPVSKHPSGKS